MDLKVPQIEVDNHRITIWFPYSTLGVTVDHTQQVEQAILNAWKEAMQTFHDDVWARLTAK